MSSKEKAAAILKRADVEINGSRPWDIQVHDERLYDRVFSEGTLGMGEAYMDEWWSVKDLAEFFSRVLKARLNERVRAPGFALYVLKSKMRNLQAGKRAYHIGEAHYDRGNDLYRAMLGERMTYTCAYWKDATTLEAAQDAKHDLICRKIGLKAGDSVLDIGGGWASFGMHAAENYGAEVTAITVSKEQAALGAERSKGLPVDVRVQDYRDVDDGPYDKIVSVGMIEHVGHKNYRTFMEAARRLLKDSGLFLLHTIGNNESVYATDPWLDRYIFPGGMLPSIQQLGASIEQIFVMEDWHNFSADYDKTLTHWFKNFDAAWPTLKVEKYDDRFYRMWTYYLLSSAGGFRARKHQLWQLVLSKNGVQGGYQSIR